MLLRMISIKLASSSFSRRLNQVASRDMSNKSVLKLIALILLSSTFSGCTFLQPVTLPKSKVYVVNQQPELVRSSYRKHPKTLLVLSPVANAGFQGKRIAIVSSPYRMRYFDNAHWIATPSEMLRTVIANTLARTRTFHSVLEQPESARADYRLSSRLLKYQYEKLGRANRVRVVIKTFLINNHTGSVVNSRLFEKTLVVQDDSLYAVVLSFNRATAAVAKSISDSVIRNV